MRKKYFMRLKILALMLCFTSKFFGTISGPATMWVGTSQYYTWSGVGSLISWQTDNAGATFANTTVNPGNLTISANFATCKVKITATYQYYDSNTQNLVTTTEDKYISIDPYLKTNNTTIYPNQSANIVCWDYCVNEAGHNLCVWDWGSAGSNCTGCGNNSTLNSVLISFPTQGTPASHNITCVQKCGANSFQYGMAPMTISYKLYTPTISGPAGTACNGVPANLVFSASQDNYAGYYVWTIPSGWTINGNANGNQINVTTNGTSVGAVTAKAYFSNGSAICSNVGTYNVACCPSIVYATGIIFSGSDLKTAVSQVIATSAIGNGADAKYHAGDEVVLISDFCVAVGSTFHGYIEPGCNETYYRTIPNDNLANGTTNEQSNEIDTNLSSQISESDSKINIFPNPNDGKFKIVLSGADSPVKIIIFNSVGQEIRTIENPVKNQIDVDLTNNQEGLYLVSIQYQSKIETRKVIKK